ncbi:MAG: efflux RND transporter permease subunit [Patescibacteria group bacterium]
MAQQSSDKRSYLDELKFNNRLYDTWFGKYISNIRIVMLLLLAVIGLGVYSFITLPRELNPEINIPIIFVGTGLPGASPEDVEQLVTIPIEDEIKGITGINTYTSTSREGSSTISIEFTSDTDVDKVKDEVQSAVDNVRDLPDDATDPSVQAIDFQDTPIWTFTVVANGDAVGLNRFSENLQDRIEEQAIIDRVEVSGLNTQQIQIVARPEVVREKGITPTQLSRAIASAVSSYPAGNVYTDTSSLAVSIDATANSVEDIRNTRISLQGEVFSLGEIADVYQGTKPGEADSYYATDDSPAQKIVTFNVYKIGTAKIDEAVAQTREIVNAEVGKYPQIEVNSVIDYSNEITDQFNNLAENFGQTILLVFLVMLLFLGLREAFLASLSIPLSIMVTFAVMQATGITISFISLFSLLLALGLLVDNSIVIITAITAYYRSGRFTPLQTGLLVFKDFFTALIGTNITTVWAFLPLLLASGIIGEFIKPIPIVVSTTILSSALVGFFLTLPIALIILKPQIPKRLLILFGIVAVVALGAFFIGVFPRELYIPGVENNVPLNIVNGVITIVVPILAFVLSFLLIKSLGALFLLGKKRVAGYLKTKPEREQRLRRFVNSGLLDAQRMAEGYRSRIDAIISSKAARWKVIGVVTIFSIVSYLLPITGLVQNEFFPGEDADLLYIELELPAGTNLETSEQEARTLLNELRKTGNTKFVTADIGSGAPTGTTGGGSGVNMILFTLNLVPAEERDVTSQQIAEQLRNTYGQYPLGDLSVVEQSGGPPAGADIQISYLGPDLAQLDQYATRTREYLKGVDGVTNIDQSVKSGTSKLVFVPDRKKMADYGVSEQDIGLWLRSFASGFELDTLKLDGTDYDIVFRMNTTNESPEDISAIAIPTATGEMLPLQALGRLELQSSPTVINREDGRRVIAVTGSVREGYNVPEIGGKLEGYADTELNLAAGYDWQTGGVNEENERSVQSIVQAMGLSAVLILITLVLQLGSFRKAVIVMLVIPLAVSGVFIIFGLFGIPLSFPALIGMLALFGIVVNNSIIIVEKINQNLEIGFPLNQAISDASASRLEPILLTTLTTIIGLIPITLSDPIWRGLGGAIIAGLVFSGTLMLFFIPVVYAMWFQGEKQNEK